MRLIDADALKASYIVPSTTTNSLCYLYVSLEDINNAPTIESEPVRRGRWKVSTNDGWVCSECGVGDMYAYSWDIKGHKLQDRYCPHCGAKMEEQKV